MPVGALVGEFFMKTAHIKEGLVLAFGPPPIFGLGTAGGFEFYIQNRGEGGAQRLAEVVAAVARRRGSRTRCSGRCNTLWRANVPQLYVDVDREKAKALGVPIDEVYNTLAATLGTLLRQRLQQVRPHLAGADVGGAGLPQAPGRHRRHLCAQRASGEMVPLAALAQRRVLVRPGHAGPLQQPAGGEDLRQRRARRQLGRGDRGQWSASRSEVLPPEFSFDWGGASFQEKRSGGTSILALGLGALMVFLILAAQYEKWSLPLSVLLALPFGTFGALAAVTGCAASTNDVYFQIGLVTLLGLAAKNAILIVEYAVLKKHEGLSTSAAALEAARLRFRPILMTSLAFILGVMPLAFSTGAGAGARHSVGTGVMGGMLAATFLAIFFVPLFFKLIVERKLSDPRSTRRSSRSRASSARAGAAGAPHTPNRPHAPHGGHDMRTRDRSSRRLRRRAGRLRHRAGLRAARGGAAGEAGGTPRGRRHGRTLVDSCSATRRSTPWSTRRSPRNRDLAAAAQRIEQARAQFAVTRADQCPAVGMEGAASRERASRAAAFPPPPESIESNTNRAVLRASLGAGFLGQVPPRDRSRAGGPRGDRSRPRRDAGLAGGRGDARLLALRALDRGRAVALRTLEGRRKGLELQRLRFEAGVMSELELRQVEESDVAGAEALLPQIEQDRPRQERRARAAARAAAPARSSRRARARPAS